MKSFLSNDRKPSVFTSAPHFGEREDLFVSKHMRTVLGLEKRGPRPAGQSISHFTDAVISAVASRRVEKQPPIRFQELGNPIKGALWVVDVLNHVPKRDDVEGPAIPFVGFNRQCGYIKQPLAPSVKGALRRHLDTSACRSAASAHGQKPTTATANIQQPSAVEAGMRGDGGKVAAKSLITRLHLMDQAAGIAVKSINNGKSRGDSFIVDCSNELMAVWRLQNIGLRQTVLNAA